MLFHTGNLRIDFHVILKIKNLISWNTYVKRDTIVIENCFNLKVVFGISKILIEVKVCITLKKTVSKKLLDDTFNLLSIFNEEDDFNLEKFLTGKIQNFNINLINDLNLYIL